MQDIAKPYIKKLFNLREGAEDKSVVIENIRYDAEFSSAQLWILVFAIGIASIGLNINSIPLVIGAMLISPLMGPLVSMGMSLATNDWHLLRKSFRNLLILVSISIGISTIYFAISPISNAQSELLSRIEPTIFDVLVAVFGGLAGFIGISRSRQSNVIPGVAIATALMPPLCTIGYGLGTLQAKFVFGALYLFVINSVFMCLSALLVSKYLRLPKVKYEDEAFQKRSRRIIMAIIFIIIAPAIYLAYTFVERNDFYLNADNFVKTVFEDRGYVIVYEDIDYAADPRTIELGFLTERFSEEQIVEFQARLIDFDLVGTELNIRQSGFTLSDNEWEELITNMQNDNEKLHALELRLASEQFALPQSENILRELRVFDERIANIGLGRLAFADSTGEEGEQSDTLVVHVYLVAGQLMTLEEKTQITTWLKERLSDEGLVVYFIPDISSSEVLGVATSTASSTEE